MNKSIFGLIIAAATYAPQAFGDPAFGGGGTLPLGGVQLLSEGHGTLPLELPDHGVLPLKLQGAATATSKQLATGLTITAVTQAQAAAGTPTSRLSCQLTSANLSRHEATGTIQIDGTIYNIDGICYDGDTATMEVVATDLIGCKTSLAAPLPAASPTELNGRLAIVGATPAAGHYLFDIKAP